MKIIKILSIAALSLIMAGTSHAQSDARQNMTPERKAEIMSERLSEKLQLTDVQTQKVRGLILQDQKRKEQMRKENQVRREEFRNSLRAILTPEQMKTFEELLEERKAQRSKHFNRGERTR